MFHPGNCVLEKKNSIAPAALNVLRPPVCLIPKRSFALGGTYPLGQTLAGYGAYDLHSRTLTVFDEARSLRLCLSSFGVRAGYTTPLFFRLLATKKKNSWAYTHPGFLLQSVTSFHWLGLTRYYETIRHLAILRLGFPFRLYLPYLVCVYTKETTRLPSVICTFCSIHPDPNHVDEPYKSFPFVCFPVGYTLVYKFPRFLGGSP
ncbi:hypothetical protein FHR92_004147 [Fontibacillus solani]|uniref:Uncharacterized protein n=1 Tax=Fontibacillus solani TaxID=1572857 RepID=A0A7W3XTC8_9BACL|nr:hypothetical protein [Fontibacillus solani]